MTEYQKAHLEGYCDGIAGAGSHLEDISFGCLSADHLDGYIEGFDLASMDRRAMLRREVEG